MAVGMMRADHAHDSCTQRGKTYREIVVAMAVGECIAFGTFKEARSAASAASKLYLGRRYQIRGAFLTRIE